MSKVEASRLGDERDPSNTTPVNAELVTGIYKCITVANPTTQDCYKNTGKEKSKVLRGPISEKSGKEAS